MHKYLVCFFYCQLISGMSPSDQFLLDRCKKNNTTIHPMLINHNSVNLADSLGKVPLHYAARYDIHGHLTNALCKEDPETISKADIEGITPLHEACLYGNTKTTEKLLASRANPNAQTILGKTPAHRAIYIQNIRDAIIILRTLKNAHADFSIVDQYGYTPLHLSVLNEKPELFNLLVELGADPHTLDNEKRSSLDLVHAVITKLPESRKPIKALFQKYLIKFKYNLS